ncbi:MAG: hypothetical protein KDA25_04970, partial [Phycisphaerales bacterium]|nr:hypothetical protein [Phycisphaerales bacterium]
MVRSHPPRSPSILAASAAVALLAGLPVLAARGAEETSNETGWAEHDSCLHGRLERAAGAAAGDLYDEQTGRDLRHFAPDRLVDYLHMTLEMRFEDLDDARFVATETLRFRPIGPGVDGLTLDAVGLDIRAATLDGHAVEHYHDGNTLTLRFPGPLDPAREYALGFDYVCADPVDGMVFTPAAPEVGYTAEVHTQGQSDTNRHWFIAHDFPNERLATELIVDVPARFAVSSNGRLVSHDVRDDRAVWHYLQERPHVSYLVSLVIGEFDIVRIPHDRVDMQVWGQRGTAADILGTFGRTGEMIDLFEERFGVPYPWDRYDQLCVKNF